MQITSLRLTNFKGWADTGQLKLAPVTGIFGANSSGKTALLQSLLLMKQTAESQDRTRVLYTGEDRSYVDLGTFSDLVHQHRTGAVVGFDASWRIPGEALHEHPDLSSGPSVPYQDVRFVTEIVQHGEGDAARPVVQKFEYQHAGRTLGMSRREGDEDKYQLVKRKFPLRRKQGRAWPLPAPVRCYGFPDKVFEYYLNAGELGEYPLAFEELLSAIHYVGPLREYPKRTYTWAGEPPVDVGSKGERAVHALLAARTRDVQISRGQGRGRRYRAFDKYLADWLKHLGLAAEFDPKPIARGRKEYEVRIRTAAKATRVLLTDVGFGVSQVLPVLVQCLYAEAGDILLFEQPEIHLHPRVQAGLADVFIDVALNQQVQIIFESHSEYFLRRLQRRIAEEAIEADKVALYFCSRDSGTNALRAEPLEVDLYGNIINWPTDFFADDMIEVAERVKAELRRRGGS